MPPLWAMVGEPGAAGAAPIVDDPVAGAELDPGAVVIGAEPVAGAIVEPEPGCMAEDPVVVEPEPDAAGRSVEPDGVVEVWA